MQLIWLCKHEYLYRIFHSFKWGPISPHVSSLRLKINLTLSFPSNAILVSVNKVGILCTCYMLHIISMLFIIITHVDISAPTLWCNYEPKFLLMSILMGAAAKQSSCGEDMKPKAPHASLSLCILIILMCYLFDSKQPGADHISTAVTGSENHFTHRTWPWQIAIHPVKKVSVFLWPSRIQLFPW